ncbi:TetR/AcrR family transcriptional regulator [Amycolatopsis acidicola]|uniref:TetR/AcrR family transcriptional regulator n=1 Tax=Amycolatopsis acidicola TaxID=2596893 RepID=A0A5N0UMR0_9PSEU|nr:TetR/AcrR family transcriptional regulator [Amycolatopsis acidicola]KAA9150888.1 TetR/AcrR family transcriptional regulator [Amycolatopsis acidicola]
MPEARRRGDARRNDQLILEAAARLLAADPRTTIQAVADEAGVVRLTVYRRYPNKNALRRAIFEAAAEEAHRVVTGTLARDLGAVEALRELIIGMAAIARRYPLLSVGTDLQPLPGDARRPVPPPMSGAMQRAVLELIRRGQREGSLRADLPAELLPQAIVGTLRTTLRFARSLGSDPARLGAQVADLLLGGFALSDKEHVFDDRP